MSKTKIYFNIFISLLFIVLGIYLISMSDDETKIIGIPFRILIGVAGIFVNVLLAIKWIYILKSNSQ